MTNLERLTAWHKAQIGTKEQGNNRVRYNDIYYGKQVSGDDFPWCAAYIWCGFQETGLAYVFLDGGKSAYCPFIMSWAKAHNRWVTGGYREGDLLLYDWGSDGIADHIGYCLSWDGTTATAIEGNASDMVAQVRRPKGQILGAYRPDYGGENATSHNLVGADDRNDSLPELTSGSTGHLVTIAQRRLIALGYALPQWGADGDFGDETKMAVLCLQNDSDLYPDAVIGNKTWSVLLDGGKR